MRLPEDDEAYLTDKGYVWELIPSSDGGCLVIKNYAVNPDRYAPTQTDLMIRIPAQYNIAGLDMFYVDPPLRLRSNGAYPEAATSFENHAGRTWQRFSRHLAEPWRAGIDGLPMFLSLIHKELQGRS